MAHLRESTDKALKLLRTLPRVQIGNLRPNPNSKQNVSKICDRLNNIAINPCSHNIFFNL